MRLIWNYKRPWVARCNPVKENNTGGIVILDFKAYDRAIVRKIVYWHKNQAC